MKTRVIQDARTLDRDGASAPDGASRPSTQSPGSTEKEQTMEAVALPAPSVVDAPFDGPVVSAENLRRRYGEGDTAVDALRGVSLDVAQGALTAVMGPSGSGKSTLMHILAGLDKATAGEVTLAGTAISGLNDNELTKLRRRHIGFIFQFFNLLPMLNAEENVVLPLTIAGEKPDKAWIDELLKSVGLDDRRSHRPSELSGGQQQRVAIGRALVSRPTIVLADGLIVRDLGRSDAHAVLGVMEELAQ